MSLLASKKKSAFLGMPPDIDLNNFDWTVFNQVFGHLTQEELQEFDWSKYSEMMDEYLSQTNQKKRVDAFDPAYKAIVNSVVSGEPSKKAVTRLVDAKRKNKPVDDNLYYQPQGPGGSGSAKSGGSHPEKNNQTGSGVIAASLIPAAISNQLKKPVVIAGIAGASVVASGLYLYRKKN